MVREYDCQAGGRTTGENEKCRRIEHLPESFSTECLSLSSMLAVIGQIFYASTCRAMSCEEERNEAISWKESVWLSLHKAWRVM